MMLHAQTCCCAMTSLACCLPLQGGPAAGWHGRGLSMLLMSHQSPDFVRWLAHQLYWPRMVLICLEVLAIR